MAHGEGTHMSYGRDETGPSNKSETVLIEPGSHDGVPKYWGHSGKGVIDDLGTFHRIMCNDIETSNGSHGASRG